jgi:hypothetical protein
MCWHACTCLLGRKHGRCRGRRRFAHSSAIPTAQKKTGTGSAHAGSSGRVLARVAAAAALAQLAARHLASPMRTPSPFLVTKKVQREPRKKADSNGDEKQTVFFGPISHGKGTSVIAADRPRRVLVLVCPGPVNFPVSALPRGSASFRCCLCKIFSLKTPVVPTFANGARVLACTAPACPRTSHWLPLACLFTCLLAPGAHSTTSSHSLLLVYL